MGISIVWRIIDPVEWHSVGTGAPNHLKDCLCDAFWSLPIILSEKDLDKLYGMKAAKLEGIDEIINAINEHKKIEITWGC